MTAPEPATAPKPNLYQNLANGSNTFVAKAKLGFRHVTKLLNDQHEQIKKYDQDLYPLAVAAAAVVLLAVNFFSSIVFFSIGALYAVARKDKWKEGLIQPLMDVWEASTVGKIGVIALLVFGVAPFKWQIAAFAYGVYLVHEIQKEPKTPSTAAPAA